MSDELNYDLSTLGRLRDFLYRSPEFSLLAVLIVLYLFVANYFSWSATLGGGINGLNVSGGSDPYYNYRVIVYFFTTKHYLMHDAALNYPLGSFNPRNPFFEVFNVFIGTLASPFYNALSVITFSFLEFDAFFGALLVIPVYLTAKIIFGKKPAMLASVLYVLMPSNYSAGILSDGRMHTPELFFAFFTFYFFAMAVTTASKGKIFESLRDLSIRKHLREVRDYYSTNRLSTIYSLLAGASLGALMLAWQGFAYVLAILAVYFVVQLIYNLFARKPTGYLTYISVLFFALSFSMSYYYYNSLGEVSPWITDAAYIALFMFGLSVIVNIIGRRPWIITIPLLVVLAGVALIAVDFISPTAIPSILAGEGYFIKTRVYQTIAEAAAPPLGEYISGFGIGQFILGMAGAMFVVYTFLKKRNEELLFFLVFAFVSIYMSFAAARFNVTAAPAYAIMGGALLAYFVDVMKTHEIKRRSPSESLGVRKSIKGNLSVGRAGVVSLVVLLVVIPSGFGAINAAVPQNVAPGVNQEIYNSLPSFIKPLINFSYSNNQFVGTYGFGITNTSDPLNQAFAWLSTQDTNVPYNDRPSFVSWWDYGFQEMAVGQHPTVADDFQQGYQVGGQTLLAQNQSQIISLFIARVMQGIYQNNSNSIPASTMQSISSYLGSSEATFLAGAIANPGSYINTVLNDPATYGHYVKQLTAENALFAVFTGSLSTKYPLSTIVNLYQMLTTTSGYSIKYIGIPNGLFPVSGTNPGIFYAPAYLTDGLSYTFEGEIVPYPYYQIYAVTSNNTYALNKTPTTALITNYNIVYNSAFYNTSIYRFTIGYPPTAVGGAIGQVPGLTFNQTTAPIMPAWNMSNFELVYAGVPWNPYKDYQNHTKAWTVVPIQTAYKYRQEGYGTVILLPAFSSIYTGYNPIVAYYPGAIVKGKITLPDGSPVSGVNVTIFDQYGIPHEITQTNATGCYQITALPGNDTIYVSTGKINTLYEVSNNVLGFTNMTVTQAQGERLGGVNTLGGVPGYVITHDFTVTPGNLTGRVEQTHQINSNATTSSNINSGTLTFTNSSTGQSYTTKIADGNYSINNMAPEHYSVSMSYDGNLYSNISDVAVTPSSTSTQNIQLVMNTIFSSDFVGNNTLVGASFTATSNGFTTTAVSNSTGIATMCVPPGNYTVYSSGSGYISTDKYASFPTWGGNKTFLFNPVNAATVTGTVFGVAPSVINFYLDGNISLDYTAKVTANRYSVTLPIGYYTTYANLGMMVFARSQLISSNTTINLQLTQGYYANLTATTNTTLNQTGYFEALSSNALLTSPYSSSHNYMFLVPVDIYTFAAYFSGINLTKTLTTGSFKTIQILGNLSLGMRLSYQNNLTAYPFDNLSLPSGGQGPPLTSGIVEITQNSIPVFYGQISQSTSVPTIFPINAVKELGVLIYSPLYNNGTYSISSQTFSYKVGAFPLASYLRYSLDSQGGPKVTGQLSFSGLEDYAFNIVNNTASGVILPGIYTVSAISVNSTVNISGKIVPVPLSTNFTSGSTYSSLVNFFSLESVFMVYNTAGVQVSATNLTPGYYNTYAASGQTSNISQTNLTSNTQVNPHLLQSSIVNFSNNLGITTGHYFITTSSGYTISTNSSILLPYGSYTIHFIYNYSRDGLDYTVSGSTSVITPVKSTVVVNVAISSATTTVNGLIRYNGSAVAYATVQFYNSTGVLVSNSTANAYGEYSANLPGGSYTLYTYFVSRGLGSIQSITVPSFGQPVQVNVTMKNAFNTYVVETLGNTYEIGNVTIKGNNGVILFNTTRESVYLPVGNYSFEGSVVLKELNYTGSTINITWSSTVQRDIEAQNTYVNVILTRVNVYNFVSGMLSNVSHSVEGGNVSNVSFFILNKGNNYVNLTLSSGYSNVTLTTNKSKVELAPGQNVTLSANIELPDNLPAGINLIPVNATYSSGSTYKIFLKVYVSSAPGFDAYLIPARNSVYGNTVSIPVVLSNTGNTNLTVNATLDSRSLASNYSWNATLNSKLGVIVNLRYYSTQTVYLNVTPLSPTAFKAGTATIQFASTSNISQTLNIPVSLSTSVNLKPTVTGTAISSFSGNPVYSLYIGIAIIAVSVVGGLILSSVRGRGRR